MTPTDNELFELSKSVYEKTKWETGKAFFDDESDNKLLVTVAIKYGAVAMLNVPLYTSDYLLEKLQRPHTSVVFEYFESFITAIRYNEEDVYIRRESDTLLKALLKLVIALHYAEELTNMENK